MKRRRPGETEYIHQSRCWGMMMQVLLLSSWLICNAIGSAQDWSSSTVSDVKSGSQRSGRSRSGVTASVRQTARRIDDGQCKSLKDTLPPRLSSILSSSSWVPGKNRILKVTGGAGMGWSGRGRGNIMSGQVGGTGVGGATSAQEKGIDYREYSRPSPTAAGAGGYGGRNDSNNSDNDDDGSSGGGGEGEYDEDGGEEYWLDDNRHSGGRIEDNDLGDDVSRDGGEVGAAGTRGGGGGGGNADRGSARYTDRDLLPQKYSYYEQQQQLQRPPSGDDDGGGGGDEEVDLSSDEFDSGRGYRSYEWGVTPPLPHSQSPPPPPSSSSSASTFGQASRFMDVGGNVRGAGMDENKTLGWRDYERWSNNGGGNFGSVRLDRSTMVPGNGIGGGDGVQGHLSQPPLQSLQPHHQQQQQQQLPGGGGGSLPSDWNGRPFRHELLAQQHSQQQPTAGQRIPNRMAMMLQFQDNVGVGFVFVILLWRAMYLSEVADQLSSRFFRFCLVTPSVGLVVGNMLSLCLCVFRGAGGKHKSKMKAMLVLNGLVEATLLIYNVWRLVAGRNSWVPREEYVSRAFLNFWLLFFILHCAKARWITDRTAFL